MQHKQSQTGFTLIEMIVSLALFSVVITIAVGALLVLIASNRQLQNEQSVLSNLSFALDSMTREIRTGTSYYCEGRPNTSAGGGNNVFTTNNLDTIRSKTDVQDCDSGRQRAGGDPTGNGVLFGVSFVEGGNSITGSGASRILYFHNSNDGKLYRRIGNNAAESIVSGGIYIADADFIVSGTDNLIGDSNEIQPKVTVFLEAYASEADFLEDESDGSREFSHKIETTITQRALDI